MIEKSNPLGKRRVFHHPANGGAVFFPHGSLVLLLGLTVAAGLGWASLGCGADTVAETDTRLHVLPFPHTPAASPQSDIVFMSLAASDLKALSVRGSVSGDHPGTTADLPGEAGVAFTPMAAFEPGEQVMVRAELASDTAAAIIGAPRTDIDFSFTVAEEATRGTPSTTTTTSKEQPPPPPTWSFKSRPDLQPPEVSIVVPDQDPGAGYVLAGAQEAPQTGPLVLDGRGQVVWFLGLPRGTAAFNLNVQEYQGNPVLAWWQGTVDHSGHGVGEYRLVDGSYQPVATIAAGAGYAADLHDLLITPRGTAVFTIYTPVQTDLTSIGGAPSGGVYDGIVQEVDIATGRVLWEWHALGHVPLDRSYAARPDPGVIWDFFHINSVEETPEGDFIVSARNTWAIYRISRATGEILSQLGGIGGSFVTGGVQFEWQHDARLLAGGRLTLFNNASYPPQEEESRAMVFALDADKMTATLVGDYTHTPPVLAGSQGNVSLLPNGNWFVGWGDQSYFSEFTPDGTVIFEGKFPAPVQSYRAFRSPWKGQPADPPTAVLDTDDNDRPAVYVSWNGATEVTRWELIGGQSADSASLIAGVETAGFETAVPIDAVRPYLTVRALDAAGKVLTKAEVAR